MPTRCLLPTRIPSPAIVGAMASEAMISPRNAGLLLLAAASFACALPCDAATAEPPSGPRVPIFRCVDANGKVITSDRPMPECANREHRQLNPDGSLNRIIPPPPTDDERAEAERKDREAKVALSAKNDAIRRDRNLMQRFPDEVTHRKARAKALDEFSGSVRNYEARITLLEAERKKLRDEAEFYVPLK